MPTLDTISAVVAALVGWPMLVALVIDVLKYFRVVDDGTSAKWNLAFNLFGFLLVGVGMGFFPGFDIPGFDKLLMEYVKVAAYVFTILIQIFGARLAHKLYLKTKVGQRYFTYNDYNSELPF